MFTTGTLVRRKFEHLGTTLPEGVLGSGWSVWAGGYDGPMEWRSAGKCIRLDTNLPLDGYVAPSCLEKIPTHKFKFGDLVRRRKDRQTLYWNECAKKAGVSPTETFTVRSGSADQLSKHAIKLQPKQYGLGPSIDGWHCADYFELVHVPQEPDLVKGFKPGDKIRVEWSNMAGRPWWVVSVNPKRHLDEWLIVSKDPNGKLGPNRSVYSTFCSHWDENPAPRKHKSIGIGDLVTCDGRGGTKWRVDEADEQWLRLAKSDGSYSHWRRRSACTLIDPGHIDPGHSDLENSKDSEDPMEQLELLQAALEARTKHAEELESELETMHLKYGKFEVSLHQAQRQIESCQEANRKLGDDLLFTTSHANKGWARSRRLSSEKDGLLNTCAELSSQLVDEDRQHMVSITKRNLAIRDFVVIAMLSLVGLFVFVMTKLATFF